MPAPAPFIAALGCIAAVRDILGTWELSTTTAPPVLK